MNYKPDEKDWMAYLYHEMEEEEKQKFELYLLENAEARTEFEKFLDLRRMISSVRDKEVIAPPIFVSESKQRFLWNTTHFKTLISIAASLLLVMLAGKLTDTRVRFSNNEFRLSFGELKDERVSIPLQSERPMLTATQVQEMINASLHENKTAFQEELNQSQQKLNASIRKNLAVNSDKIDQLVREAATASQDQIRQYVANMQSQNMQAVKDYFQLTSGEQKKYIEDLLVDFSEYLQQQRSNDLQLVQTQLNSLQNNTDIFKQETEQILTSIITTVGSAQTATETKN